MLWEQYENLVITTAVLMGGEPKVQRLRPPRAAGESYVLERATARRPRRLRLHSR